VNKGSLPEIIFNVAIIETEVLTRRHIELTVISPKNIFTKKAHDESFHDRGCNVVFRTRLVNKIASFLELP